MPSTLGAEGTGCVGWAPPWLPPPLPPSPGSSPAPLYAKRLQAGSSVRSVSHPADCLRRLSATLLCKNIHQYHHARGGSLTRLQVDALPLGLRLQPLHLRLQVCLGRQQLQLLRAHRENLHSVRRRPHSTLLGACGGNAAGEPPTEAAACKNGSGAPQTVDSNCCRQQYVDFLSSVYSTPLAFPAASGKQLAARRLVPHEQAQHCQQDIEVGRK